MEKNKKGLEPKQEIQKIQNGLYLVEQENVKIFVTNLGTALKEATQNQIEALKALNPDIWERMQIAAMVAIDNMVKQEARK